MSKSQRRNADIEYFEWLVASRSRNQAASLKLLKIMKAHRDTIVASENHVQISQALIAVSFSLWRAVFLSDVTPDRAHSLGDAENFLENLVHNNAVAYPQDRNARYFSFQYYVSNARFRLHLMSERITPKLNSRVTEKGVTSEKWWDAHQNILEEAISNYEKLLSEGAEVVIENPDFK